MRSDVCADMLVKADPKPAMLLHLTKGCDPVFCVKGKYARLETLGTNAPIFETLIPSSHPGTIRAGLFSRAAARQ